MVKKLRATFDGKVFLPREFLDIKPNTEWVIVISDEKGDVSGGKEMHPLEAITRLSTDMGPADLSENFDRYTRGLKDNGE
ncbi:MAG: hypothetical protein AB1611_15835 [bacterium]